MHGATDAFGYRAVVDRVGPSDYFATLLHLLGGLDLPSEGNVIIDEQNADVFGDCANPTWHGHNYELDVTVEGPVDPETGYVMDLKHLKQTLEERVLADVDHRNLNTDVAWLEGTNPTTENLVVAIWNRIRETLPDGVWLSRIVLHETPRNSVEYRGERAS